MVLVIISLYKYHHDSFYCNYNHNESKIIKSTLQLLHTLIQ